MTKYTVMVEARVEVLAETEDEACLLGYKKLEEDLDSYCFVVDWEEVK